MYSRKVGSKILTFGHEGVLFKNSFIMYDKETKSLWVHTTGEALKGPLKGKQLEFVVSTVTTWGRWKETHEKTTVLTGRKARGFMGAYRLSGDMGRYGLSLGQGRTTKLYRFATLREKRVVNDEFDGEKVVILFDEKGLTGLAFQRGKRTFRFEDGKLLDDRDREWNPIEGTSGDEKLIRLPATPWLTHRWKAFYPEGAVYSK